MFPNFRVRLPEVIAGPGPHILAEVTLIWTEQISIYLRPLTSAPIPNSDAPVFGYEDRSMSHLLTNTAAAKALPLWQACSERAAGTVRVVPPKV